MRLKKIFVVSRRIYNAWTVTGIYSRHRKELEEVLPVRLHRSSIVYLSGTIIGVWFLLAVNEVDLLLRSKFAIGLSFIAMLCAFVMSEICIKIAALLMTNIAPPNGIRVGGEVIEKRLGWICAREEDASLLDALGLNDTNIVNRTLWFVTSEGPRRRRLTVDDLEVDVDDGNTAFFVSQDSAVTAATRFLQKQIDSKMLRTRIHDDNLLEFLPLKDVTMPDGVLSNSLWNEWMMDNGESRLTGESAITFDSEQSVVILTMGVEHRGRRSCKLDKDNWAERALLEELRTLPDLELERLLTFWYPAGFLVAKMKVTSEAVEIEQNSCNPSTSVV